jgi:hypothetical protein
MTREELIGELTDILKIRKKIDPGMNGRNLGILIGRLIEYEHPGEHKIIGERPAKPKHIRESSHDYRFGMVAYIETNTRGAINITATSTTPLDLIEAIADRYGL